MTKNIFYGKVNKMILVSATALLLVLTPVLSKEIKYKVSDIPKELRENARSVVRYDVSEFEVKSISSATQKVIFAITILNNNGFDDANFTQYYDKFTKISGINGKIYDANGEKVKSIHSDDILDYSAISGYSIYEDSRIKYIDPKYRTVPFTVEYSYEISYNGLFMYPGWSPLLSPFYNISTEYSSSKIIVPHGFKFRYSEKNIPVKALVTESAANDVYFWEIRNLKALIDEPLNASSKDFIPLVIAAPNDFEIDGFTGNLSSWQNFGIWISTLNEGKNNLTETTKMEILNLVKEAKTDFEKIKIIYEYMQGRTRYVSIQVGIGGWQPFEAATVHRLSYGDCKALANYTKSLLDVVGIKAYYLLVQAGENPSTLDIAFPASQFNHAFVCIPQKSDTIWLECTSQRMPCGYIGDFTDDRDVLLIDKDQSKIVHTKIYSAKDNTESRKSIVTFISTNGGNATINTNYKGVCYDNITPVFYADNVDKIKRISNRIHLPSFLLKSFSYKENRAIIPSIDETLDITFENYCTIAGQRVFMPLNFMNRFDNIPERVRNRKTDVFIRRAYTEIDTVVYELPAYFKVEALPPPVDILSPFGTYKAKAEIIDKKLVYVRYFLMNKGKYPPTAYADLLAFYEKVSTADRVQCSLMQ